MTGSYIRASARHLRKLLAIIDERVPGEAIDAKETIRADIEQALSDSGSPYTWVPIPLAHYLALARLVQKRRDTLHAGEQNSDERAELNAAIGEVMTMLMEF